MWQLLYSTPLSNPIERLNWTTAIVQNRAFFYRQDLDFILELDTTTTPGIPAIIAHTPTFVNMAGAQGIFQANSRLGMWDQENSIYWSNVNDLLDFTPSLATQANVVQVNHVKGKIVHVEQCQEGFIIYTTANIVGMFSIEDRRAFYAVELSDNLGIFSKDHHTVGYNGEHIVWSNGAFWKVNANRDPRRASIENIFTDVSDYIKGFVGYPRLSHVANRWIIISLIKKDFVSGKNIIQRRKFAGNTYYEPNQKLRISYTPDPVALDFIVTNYTPEGYIDPISITEELPCLERELPYPDPEEQYTPIDYPPVAEGEVPSITTQGAEPPVPCDTGVLWGCILRDQAPYYPEMVPHNPQWLLGKVSGSPTERYEYDNVSGNFQFWPDAIVDAWAPYVKEPGVLDFASDYRLSFNPYSIMATQLGEWKRRYHANWQNSANFKGSSETWEGYVTDVVAVDPGITTIIEDATPLERRNMGLWGTRVDIGDTITYTHYKKTYDENGTRLHSYSETVKRRIAKYAKGSQPYQIWTEVGSSTSNVTEITGQEYLANTTPHPMYNDSNFMQRIYAGANAQEASRHIGRLSQLGQTYPTTNPDFWGTVMNLVGISDGCTYASCASYAARRAYNKNLQRTERVYYRTELAYDDPDDDSQGWYYLRVKVDFEDQWDIDRFVYESTNIPSAGGYGGLGLTTVPVRDILYIHPIARITHPDGLLPNSFLHEYDRIAVQRYPSKIRPDAILQVYEDEGWTIQSVNQAIPEAATTPLELELAPNQVPETHDKFNDAIDSGFWTELDQFNTICEQPVQQKYPVVPLHKRHDNLGINYNYSGSPTFTKFNLEAWRVQQPGGVVLEGSSSTGAIYPEYDVALIYDELLEKWGVCNEPFEVFMSYRPANAQAYNPAHSEGTSKYTYEDFLSTMGAVLSNGAVVVWDRFPALSYLVVGKAGFRREHMTRMTEVVFEFGEVPNAFVGAEFSMDGRFVIPEYTKLRHCQNVIEYMTMDETARSANFVVIGHYHLIQIQYTGRSAGRGGFHG